MTTSDKLSHLLTIQSVREKTTPIFQLGLNNKLNFFNVDLSKLPALLDYVIEIIQRDFQTNYETIPPHGRWNHLNAGGKPRLETLIESWRNEFKFDELEIGRKLIDLITFSVLIDAGAGNEWSYKEVGSNDVFARSEGLAIVSIDLFKKGEFSDDSTDPFKITGDKLISFDKLKFVDSFQITKENPLSGEDGRLSLIQNLGHALKKHPEIFGKDGRPGNLIDYLAKIVTGDDKVLDVATLWDTIMVGFASIWPKRIVIDDVSLGDAWPLSTVNNAVDEPLEFIDTIVPFHKLTQWLVYSLLQPLREYGYKFTIKNENYLTGLPEYRNGGLLVDFGVLSLKPEVLSKGLELTKELDGELDGDETIPTFKGEDETIVEWRTLTIGFLDYILPLINSKIGFDLSLAQLIEAGSWKSGREIAKSKRPSTGGPPINLYSDGTIF